ncbi:integrase core domain-containing protein [Pochonia chlamydosporia 170]|uniref:Integrase core domain-containing protein n=1 Tax=Pochonia chlamydosporia 170 TaxID=1380566 RepID=A0A179EXJ8_METCM|nr:integrase core domain-containing protein [Pochonia chlamydosporia 170]OAQ57917.1 integrase core domain-containing protein [Pochonia chlamydosporia 170]
MASIKLTNESVEAHVEILQGQENYLAWKRDLKFIAEANNVWKILTGEEDIQDKPTRPTLSGFSSQAKSAKKSIVKDVDPSGSSAEAQTSDISLTIQFYKLDLDEYEKQQKRFRYARGILSTTINTALRGCIKDEENPHLAMEKLKGLCKMNDARALDMTLGKIEQLKFKGSVSDLINTLKTFQQDIFDLDGTFSDDQIMSKVVRSLPNRFNRFLDSWNLLAGTAALPRDLVTLHGHLLGVEAQMVSEKEGKEYETRTKGRERKERQLCEGCNKWGNHSEAECWIAHPELRENKNNKAREFPRQFKAEINTVKSTRSKDNSKYHPQQDARRPGKIVATVALQRDQWETTCAKIGPSERTTNVEKPSTEGIEFALERKNPESPLSLGAPQLLNVLSPRTMMLLKDEALEPSHKWIVDSGANVCIANDKSWFSEFQKIAYTVGTAGDGGLRIAGAGTVPLHLITDGNETVELELHNVAYAQDARCNILSLSWIAEKAKLRGIWGIKGISIMTADGFEIGHASLIDGLYHLQVKPPIAEAPKRSHLSEEEPIALQVAEDTEAARNGSTLAPDQCLPPGVQPPFVVSLLDYNNPVWKWHRRMGHLSIQSMRDLLKVSNGIDLTDKQLQGELGVMCPICATTKAVNRVPRDPATRRAANPGEMMHADAWGPYPVSAWDSTIYILAMTDDATRFTWSARYITKDKIPEVFRHLHRTIEKRNNITIRAYRLDNEFPLYGELRDWFQRHAISLENSVPYTHHMNGVAERGFRTDRERASAILQEATNSVSATISKILGTRSEETMRNVSLSETLWVEAFAHAIWIKNRSPSRALEGKMTPWQALYKVEPNLAIERIFGSRVYVTYPPEHRQKTLLQPRGWLGYFVGFETEAVLRIWHPDKKRVVRVTAPRVDDGQGQEDVHEGATLSDRNPVGHVSLDDSVSDNVLRPDDLDIISQPQESSSEDLENCSQTMSERSPYFTRLSAKVSPYFAQNSQDAAHRSGDTSVAAHPPRSENLSDDQETQSNASLGSESDNSQEEVAGINYDTWDGDHAFHAWQAEPQVHMLAITHPSDSHTQDNGDRNDTRSPKAIVTCIGCQTTHSKCAKSAPLDGSCIECTLTNALAPQQLRNANLANRITGNVLSLNPSGIFQAVLLVKQPGPGNASAYLVTSVTRTELPVAPFARTIMSSSTIRSRRISRQILDGMQSKDWAFEMNAANSV